METNNQNHPFFGALGQLLIDVFILIFVLRRSKRKKKLDQRDAYISQLENEIRQLKGYNL